MFLGIVESTIQVLLLYYREGARGCKKGAIVFCFGYIEKMVYLCLLQWKERIYISVS